MPQRVVVEAALARWRRAEATMNAAAGSSDWRAAVAEARFANIAYQVAVGSARPAPRPAFAERDMPLRYGVAEPVARVVVGEFRPSLVMVGAGAFGLRAIK